MATVDELLWAIEKLEQVRNLDPYWEDWLQPALTLLSRYIDEATHTQEAAPDAVDSL